MAISVVDLSAKTLATDDWIVEGLLTRRNTAFLMGPPKKSAKSWLLLNAAWALSEGLPIWGVPHLKPPRPMRVVYFTQEDTESNIQKRVLMNINVAQKVPNVNLWVVPKNLNIKLDNDHGVGLVIQELNQVVREAGPIDLVIFDPMRRIHGGEENDSSIIARLWDVIDGLHNSYGCATIIAHHVKKPPNDRTTFDPTDPYQGRGSGDIYGGGDAFVMVVPGPLAPDGRSWRRVNLHFESKRGEQMLPVTLEVSFQSGDVKFVATAVPAI